MALLAVDPEVLDGAGAAVVSAGEGLGSVIATLTTALSGIAGMIRPVARWVAVTTVRHLS
jgi:hypothetical protein